MKNIFRLFNTLLFAQIVFTSCSVSKSSVNSEIINCSNLDSINLVLNQNLMDEYIKYIEENNITIPLFGIKSINVKHYQTTIEELKYYRGVFEKYDTLLLKRLEKDYEYNELLKRKASKEEKQSVYERLSRTDDMYRYTRIKRDKSLNESNLMTLKYIYYQYKSQNKLFPTEFISQDLKEKFQKHKDLVLKRKYDETKMKCEKQENDD